MTSTSKLKTNFVAHEKYSAFYTGGLIRLSNDGANLFCGCNKEIKVVDLKTGKIVSSIGQNEEEEITQFILMRDDEHLILSTQNQLFRQWKWKDKLLVKTWRSVHNAPVTSLAFESTDTLLASGSADSTVKVWDIFRGYFTHNFRGHTGVVRLLAFHPDSKRLQLVSAAEDYTVKVWDLASSACISSSQCHTSLVTSTVFADKDSTMYSAGKDNIVCVWNTESWKVVKTIPIFQPVVSMFIPLEFPSLIDDDGVPRFVTVSSKGDVTVVNAETCRQEYSNNCRLSDPDKETEDADAYITQALYSPDLNGIILTTYDQNIVVISRDFTTEKQLCGHLDDILNVQFFGEQDSHIAVASNTDLLKVFKRDSWECQLLQGHSDIITTVDVRGNILASGSKDSTIRLWQLCPSTGFVSCLAMGHGHTQAVMAVTLARATKRPAFLVSGGADLTIKLWQFPGETEVIPMATLRVSATEHAHDKDINCLAVAPNDKIIASGSHDKTVKIWIVEEGLHSLTLLAVLRGHRRGIWDIKFSPVDQIVGTASGDGFIKMWNLSDYSCVRTLEGHDSSVLSFMFLTNGKQIVSSGSDGLLKVWLVKTSECLKTIEGHESKVWGVSLTQEEDFLLSGGADSQLILWKDVTEEEDIEKQDKLQKQVLQEQVLSNLVADKKYLRALALTISLNKPYKALTILKEIGKQEDSENQLGKLIKKLRMDQIESLLKFAVEWNTNSRNYLPAQMVVNLVLKQFLPQDLAKLPGIQGILEGLTVYTDRHLQRLDSLLIDSHFAEYCYKCMKSTS